MYIPYMVMSPQVCLRWIYQSRVSSNSSTIQWRYVWWSSHQVSHMTVTCILYVIIIMIASVHCVAFYFSHDYHMVIAWLLCDWYVTIMFVTWLLYDRHMTITLKLPLCSLSLFFSLSNYSLHTHILNCIHMHRPYKYVFINNSIY